MHWVDIKLECVITQHTIRETISYHLMTIYLSGLWKIFPGFQCSRLTDIRAKTSSSFIVFLIISVGVSGPSNISANIYKQTSKHIINGHQTIANDFVKIVALHTDRLPACSQSLLKRDWLILLRLQTDYKRKQQMLQKTFSPVAYRFMHISIYGEYTTHTRCSP